MLWHMLTNQLTGAWTHYKGPLQGTQTVEIFSHELLLSDSNTNVNSMINRRVSLFYRYPLKVFHHMVCPCTLYGVCVVCPGTSELVGQQQAGSLLAVLQVCWLFLNFLSRHLHDRNILFLSPKDNPAAVLSSMILPS